MIEIIRQSSPTDDRRWQALLFACLLFVVTMLYGIVATHWLYQCDIVGMHVKTLITTTVYRKVRHHSHD
jgi:general stress protein CsbA